MALTELQSAILKVLASNRTETSYMAGGAVLNRDWPRISDDFDIFHDSDEDIGPAADRDIAALEAARFRVYIDIRIFGLVEATVSGPYDRTMLQWMSESRRRFLPLVRDEVWGARLHQADLAVNKVIAASARSKARDFVDLYFIANQYCDLAPLLVAAAGKPPHLSPVRSIEEIRRRIVGLWNDDFKTVKSLPAEIAPDVIRSDLIRRLDAAEVSMAELDESALGCLALDATGVPRLALRGADTSGWTFRRATEEQDAIPEFKHGPSPFLA